MSTTTRTLLLAAILLGLAGSAPAGAPVALAADPAGPGPDDVTTPSEVTPAARKAIDDGLAFLARTQNPDGSWTELIGRKVNDTYRGHIGKHVGVTALGGIAFLAAGNLPGRGQYGQNVEKAVDFVLKSVNVNGFITHDESRMYSHAFATLFLAEVYGTTRRRDVREKLKGAVELIERAQNDAGGWRYLPASKDADISVTVCQVQALRAARNAGILVDKKVITRAIEYVKNSFIRNQWDRGGVWYQIENDRGRSRHSYALTAAGVTALYGAGIYEGQEIENGLDYLERNYPSRGRLRSTFDAFYGHYYAVQAFFQAGGATWDKNYRRMRDDIVSVQRPDGSWNDLVGPHYATSMATIILLIPYRYLPIFDR